jgi:hypothetical protein
MSERLLSRAQAPEEHAHHHHHEQQRDQQRYLDLVQRGADRDRAVRDHLEGDVLRQLRAQLRQDRADRVDRLDDIGVRLPRDVHDHRRRAVHEAERVHVLHAVGDLRDLIEPDRGATAPGDHQRRIGGRGAPDVVGVYLQAPRPDLDHALRPVGVRRGERRAHVLQTHPVAVQRERVELHAHRGQRAAAELHVPDARHLQQPLLHDVRDRIVNLAAAAGFRVEGEDQDRRVRRIDLAVGRVRLERRGQVDARGVDRRLHVARRPVDVATEVELQRDARGAHGTG